MKQVRSRDALVHAAPQLQPHCLGRERHDVAPRLQLCIRRRPGAEQSAARACWDLEGLATSHEERLRMVHALVVDMHAGQGASVVACGAWGSGKSYTMGTLPSSHHSSEPSMIAQALDSLFSMLGDGATVRVSCAELLADECFDLLDQGHRKAKQQLTISTQSQQQQPSQTQQPWSRHTGRGAPIPSLAGVSLPGGVSSPVKVPMKTSSWRGGDDTARGGDDCASVSGSSAWSFGSVHGPGVPQSPSRKLQMSALTRVAVHSPSQALDAISAALRNRTSTSTPTRRNCHVGHAIVRLEWAPPGSGLGEAALVHARSFAAARTTGSDVGIGSGKTCGSPLSLSSREGCTLTMVDCCSSAAATHLPSRAACSAKRALLSLAKALAHIDQGEAAMALREAQLTRSLIGSVDKVLLVACVGGTLDAPAPVSRVAAAGHVPAAPVPGLPDSPRTVAVAGDEATAKMLRLLLQSQGLQAAAPTSSKWPQADRHQQQQPMQSGPGAWHGSPYAVKGSARSRAGVVRALVLAPAAEDAASKAQRPHGTRSPRGRDQASGSAPRCHTAAATSKTAASPPPKARPVPATPPRPRAAPSTNRLGSSGAVGAPAAGLTLPRMASQPRCRTLDSPARAPHPQPRWQPHSPAGRTPSGTSTCAQVPLPSCTAPPRERRAVSAFPALYRFDAAAKQHLEEQYKQLVTDFQSFVRTQRTSGGGRRRPTLPGMLPAPHATHAPLPAGAGISGTPAAATTHAPAADAGDEEDLFLWPVPDTVLALSPNNGITPARAPGATPGSCPVTPSRGKAASTPGGHMQPLATPASNRQAGVRGAQGSAGGVMATPTHAAHTRPAAVTTPATHCTTVSTEYGTPLEATPVRPTETGAGASPGRSQPSARTTGGSFLSSVSTAVARHQAAFKKHMSRIANSRRAKEEAAAALALHAAAEQAAAQAEAAAQAAMAGASTPLQGMPEHGLVTPPFMTPVGGAQEPAGACDFLGSPYGQESSRGLGAGESKGGPSPPGSSGRAEVGPHAQHGTPHRRFGTRLVHCCAELDNDADVKMWSWGGDEEGEGTAAASKESPGRPVGQQSHVGSTAGMPGERAGEAQGARKQGQAWRAAGAEVQRWLLGVKPLSWLFGRLQCLGDSGQQQRV